VARTKFVLNPSELTRFCTTEPGPQAGLLASAMAVQENASSLAPKGRSTGQFRMRGGVLIGPFGTPSPHGFARVSYHTRKFRGGFRVYSRDVAAHLIEYGSAQNPVYAPLRRAMRAVNRGKVVIHAAKKTTDTSTEGLHTGGMF
jgi:hypothetical protein